MTTTDYILNAVFVFFVLRQTRERPLDARSVIAPLIVVFFVASSYVHSIPTAGNDLVLLGALSAVGITLGLLGGLATHVRIDSNRRALARVGWVAGGLLLVGLLARMGFVLAVNNGAQHAIASFSMANQIGSAAWPLALVAMALLEVVVRIAVVQVRAQRLANAPAATAAAVPVPA
jgi:hypothetical protein